MGHPQLHMDYQWSVFFPLSNLDCLWDSGNRTHDTWNCQATPEYQWTEKTWTCIFSSSRGNWWAATVLMIPFTQVLCQLGILLMVLSYESFPAHRSKLKNWPSNPVETPVDPRNAVRWPHRHPQIRCCRRVIIATKGGGYWLFDLFIYRVFPAFVSWLSWVGAWRGEVHPWESTVTS